jgi:hypothetical protein
MRVTVPCIATVAVRTSENTAPPLLRPGMLRALPSNGSTHHIGPSSRLLLVCHRTFLSNGCACDVSDWNSFLPVAWFLSRNVHSPTAHTSVSWRTPVPSSSLIKCASVQVYNHQPISGVLLDPIYHIIYPGVYLTWALPWGWSLGDRATLCRPYGNPCSCPICYNMFSSDHWPASTVVGHKCGCHVDGPLNLPHDQLRVIPCLGVHQTIDRKAVRVPNRG